MALRLPITAASRAFGLTTALNSGLLRTLVSVAGWAATAPLAIAAALRFLAHDRSLYLVWINAYTFWVYLPAYPVAIAALVFRRWSLLAASLAVVGVHLFWTIPDYRGAAKIPAEAFSAPTLRLFSTNLWYGNSDPGRIFREAVQADPDILLIQEFTPEAEAILIAEGIASTLPYRIGETHAGAQGTAIYSRYPLIDAEVINVGGVPMTRATVQIEGRSLRIYNVHPVSPSSRASVAAWNRELRALRDAVAAEPGEVVVAGDFNMTQHHAWYGRFIDAGLKDAYRERGAGYATTWPNGLRKLRAIRIDQVFHTSGVVPLALRVGRGEGSDHRPVITDLAILR